jgi:hypothetical protein
MLLAGVSKMLRSIKLDNQPMREANEIHNVRTNRGLAAEFNAELASPEKKPQPSFRRRWIIAQRASEVALFPVAVHRPDLPPP